MAWVFALGAFGGCDDDETGAGAEPPCAGFAETNVCFACIKANCCPAVGACLDDISVGGCADCLAGNGDACKNSDAWIELLQCGSQACGTECTALSVPPTCDPPVLPPSGGQCVAAGSDQCNPLTSEGCAAGESCEPNAGAFMCFPEGPRSVCQPCGTDLGFCQAGSTCWTTIDITAGVSVTTQCAKTCCDDADCGSGTCMLKLTVNGGEAGVCLGGNTTPSEPDSGGAGGAAGAGGS